MKKLCILTIILFLCVSSGCSNNEMKSKITFNTNAPKSTNSEDIIKYNYTFKGENKSWKAEYKLNATEIFTKNDGTLKYKSKTDKILIVTYKKDVSDFTKYKFIKITYKTPVSKGSSTYRYDGCVNKTKTYIIRGGTENGAFEKKDDNIKVYITLDDHTQVFELKNMELK